VIKLVISNQRGGVAKTTTATTLARLWADRGRKVLLIDTDPQGSVGMSLGLKADKFLHHFVVYNHLFESCLVHATPNIDVLCSSRETIQAEASLMGVPAREMSFSLLFSKVDEPYDIVIIDVAPSITLMQTCAMVYAQSVLIPVSMDTLSLQGAGAFSAQANQLSAELTAIKTDASVLASSPSPGNLTKLTGAIATFKSTAQPLIREMQAVCP